MVKYAAVSQMLKVKDFDFVYFFKEENTLKVFKENNPKAEVCIIDNIIQNGEVFIGDKDVYYAYILPILFKKGFKKVFVYDVNNFPKIVKKISPKFLKIKDYAYFENEEDILGVFNLFEYKQKYVFVSNKLSNKDVISAAIKNINPQIKVILYGKTYTPIKDLMTNSIDYLLNNDKIEKQIKVLGYNKYLEVEEKCLVL